MGVDRVHDVLDVSASCTMFLTSVDHVHDGHDVFRCFVMFLDIDSMFPI